MDPNTAFVMALLALLVALGSLAVSAGTFWRNRTPRPHWVTAVTTMTDAEGQRRVSGSVENRGRGVAMDVKFEPENGGVMGLFARRKEERVEFGQKFDITLVYGPDVEGDGAFLLTWSEEPQVHKRRTKRLKYKLKAVPAAN
ncbi:hypothetical protein [Microbacterium sp.]|uniref:hypothetical protein n=1 Tax=Microbacterium sp. TaxID=51671 RepID=UPI003568F516